MRILTKTFSKLYNGVDLEFAFNIKRAKTIWLFIFEKISFDELYYKLYRKPFSTKSKGFLSTTVKKL